MRNLIDSSHYEPVLIEDPQVISGGLLCELRTAVDASGALLHYLLRSYPDDQWDGTTRELLNGLSMALYNEPITFEPMED